jgi:hypothetical protein
MKQLVTVTFFVFSLMSCNNKYSDEGIICDLVLSDDQEKITVKLINKMTDDIYLTNEFNLKIYRQGSNGNYSDWTDIYLNNRIALEPFMSDKSTDDTTAQITSEARSELIKEYLKKYDVKDSIQELSLRDLMDWNLGSLLFLRKGSMILQEISLYPLKHARGTYKVIYSYNPEGSFSYDTLQFNLPESINGFTRFDNKIEADTLILKF